LNIEITNFYRIKTHEAFTKKIVTINYVGELTPLAKFGAKLRISFNQLHRSCLVNSKYGSAADPRVKSVCGGGGRWEEGEKVPVYMFKFSLE